MQKKLEANTIQKRDNILKLNKIQGKTLSSLKESNKAIPLKQLDFNPLSFVSTKYSPKTLMLMNRKKNHIDEKFKNTKNNSVILNKNDKIEYIYSMNTNKIKLKPLNKNRSCSEIFPRKDDIFIPSKKTTKELINYNMSNTHNTIFNNYHKNHRNLKIINFIRTNSFVPNIISKSMDKSLSFDKSLNNNSGRISKNEISEYINQNFDFPNHLSNIKNKNTILDNVNISSYLQEENPIKIKKNEKKITKNKTTQIDYESEILLKKMPHNLKYFANNLFEEEKRLKNKKEKTLYEKININENANNKILENRNNRNLNFQIIEYKGKSRLFMPKFSNKNRKASYVTKNNIIKKHLEKNNSEIGKNDNKFNLLENNNLYNRNKKLLLNHNNNKVRNNQSMPNNKNDNQIFSYKEIREISKKGFKRMQADKYRRFNLLVQNTNKEVLQLEKKLDELLEQNKKIFEDEKVVL